MATANNKFIIKLYIIETDNYFIGHYRFIRTNKIRGFVITIWYKNKIVKLRHKINLGFLNNAPS